MRVPLRSPAQAHVVVAPWKPVFSKPLWDALVMDKIVPKLAHAVRAMAVDPAGQDLAALGWLHRWRAHATRARVS